MNRLEVRGGKVFYCRQHPDFEGLNIGKLHDHLDKNHPEVQAKEMTEIIFTEEYRISDHAWISRSWGRVPKLGSQVADSERAKK